MNPFEKILERLEDVASLPKMNRMERRVGKRQTQGFGFGIRFAKEVVQEVAEEYNNGWIACSERLPEDNGVYFVTLDDDIMPRYIDIRRFRNGKFDQNLVVSPLHDKFPEKEVAWMPLPKPYNGDCSGESES